MTWPIRAGQPAIQLLVQANDLIPGSFQVGLQSAGSTRLIRQAFLQPTFVRQVLLARPPLLPAGAIDPVPLARQFRQRIRRGLPEGFVLCPKLVQQDWDCLLATTAPENAERRL